MSDNDVLQIDIEKVIESKNPRLIKWLPGFIINYIKRVLHQEEINKFLRQNKDIVQYDFVREIIKNFKISYQLYGIDNVPKQGRYIFASNHPQGAIDSMCLIDAVYSNFGECRFVVNDVLLHLKNFHPIFLPVNHFGSQNKENARIFDEAFRSDVHILYYPAGLVSRKIKGQIRDIPWKKSFINLAIKYQRDIIPVFIDAKNSNFFYRLYKLRTMLGIKANIEMFYLADEMYKQTGNTLSIYFGSPISYLQFTKDKSATEWALFVQEKVYNLKNK
ncbi:MAG: 1-acyl-sn-glycerol-3-phosphate acyltransferase [Bacteroidales bacterium]|nr:1-acyl-sn-glycerol-3-phosphate acyltransferase [Bacteroidales bacterium]